MCQRVLEHRDSIAGRFGVAGFWRRVGSVRCQIVIDRPNVAKEALVLPSILLKCVALFDTLVASCPSSQ